MRAPDMTGKQGPFNRTPTQAWKCPIDPKRQDGSLHATICHWIVKGGFHSFWNTWQITVVHLRDLPGLPPAQKEFLDATHEFMIVALDPGKDVKTMINYDPDKLPYPTPMLQPIDVAVQFHCHSDAQAADIGDIAAKAIMAGYASPDCDYRDWWNKTIPATASCEKHPEQGMQ